MLAVSASALPATRAATAHHVTIAWVGDIALQGTPPASLFSGVRSTLSRADIAIGNLEGTLSVGGTSKCGPHSTQCFAFQSPPQSARLLRGAAFDDLNVANNHAFDYGASGQAQTLHALRVNHLRSSGRPGQITVLEANGVRVAILGFAPYPWAQSLLDIPAAKRLVAKATTHADLVVCVLHAGAEGTAYQHVPRGTEYFAGENRGNARVFARSVIDAGADLVIASGPHVLRGMQRYHDAAIAYSLGNFATSNNALSTGGVLGESGIFEITLRANGKALAGKFLPVRLVNDAPQLVHGSNDIVSRVNALSRADFGSSALLISPRNALKLNG
jgi:poly-gamma-glutamate capsule biosynthesis protein CapA/YwtB (metallophosphatase superfamily)